MNKLQESSRGGPGPAQIVWAVLDDKGVIIISIPGNGGSNEIQEGDGEMPVESMVPQVSCKSLTEGEMPMTEESYLQVLDLTIDILRKERLLRSLKRIGYS